MSRVRAADDFEAIRLRLDELRRERAQQYGEELAPRSSAQEPGAIAHLPRHLAKRILSEARRPSSR